MLNLASYSFFSDNVDTEVVDFLRTLFEVRSFS